MSVQLYYFFEKSVLIFLLTIFPKQMSETCVTDFSLDRVSYMIQAPSGLMNVFLDVYPDANDISWELGANELVITGHEGSYSNEIESNETKRLEVLCSLEILSLTVIDSSQIAFLADMKVEVFDFVADRCITSCAIIRVPTALVYSGVQDILAISTSIRDEEFGFLRDNQISLIHLSQPYNDISFVLRTGLSAVTEMWFINNGTRLLLSGFNVGLEGLEVQLWDIGTMTQVWNLSTFAQQQELERIPLVTAIASDGSRMFLAIKERSGIRTETGNTTIQIWDLISEEFVHKFKVEEETVTITALALSPVAPVLAVGMDNGMIRLWDIEAGDPIMSACEHDKPVRLIRFNSTGSLLASLYTDGKLCIWGGLPD